MVRFILQIFVLLILLNGSTSAQDSSAFNQGLQLLQENRYEQAIEHLEKAVQTNYQKDEAFILLARAYLLSDEPGQAMIAIEQGLEHFPNNVVLKYLQAEAISNVDKIEAAIRLTSILDDSYNQQVLIERGISPDQIQKQIGFLYTDAGNENFNDGSYAESADAFQNAIEHIPDSSFIHNNLVYTLLLAEQYEKAADAARTASNLFPDQPEFDLMLNQALSLSGNREESLQGFKNIYDQSPDNAKAAITYGQALIRNNKLLEAAEHFDTHLDRNPKQREVYSALLEMNRRLFDFKAMAVVYSRMIKNFPGETELREELAYVYAISSDYQQAREIYQELYSEYSEPEYAIQFVQIYLMEKKWEESIRFIESILPENESAELYDLLIRLHQQQKENSEAMNVLQTAVSKFGESPEFMIRRLEITMTMDQVDQSIKTAELLISEAPDVSGLPYLVAADVNLNRIEASIWLDRGIRVQLRMIEEMTSQIQESAQNALSGMPDLQVPLTGHSARLDYHQKVLTRLIDKVIESTSQQQTKNLLEKLTEDHSWSGTLMLSYADALNNLGSQDEAINVLQEILKNAPDEIEVHLKLANIHESNQNIRQAILAWERAFSLDSENETIYRALIRLHRENGTLNQLADRWLARYRSDSSNEHLKEYLIDALHRADRFDEAQDVISQ